MVRQTRTLAIELTPTWNFPPFQILSHPCNELQNRFEEAARMLQGGEDLAARLALEMTRRQATQAQPVAPRLSGGRQGDVKQSTQRGERPGAIGDAPPRSSIGGESATLSESPPAATTSLMASQEDAWSSYAYLGTGSTEYSTLAAAAAVRGGVEDDDPDYLLDAIRDVVETAKLVDHHLPIGHHESEAAPDGNPPSSAFRPTLPHHHHPLDTVGIRDAIHQQTYAAVGSRGGDRDIMEAGHETVHNGGSNGGQRGRPPGIDDSVDEGGEETSSTASSQDGWVVRRAEPGELLHPASLADPRAFLAAVAARPANASGAKDSSPLVPSAHPNLAPPQGRGSAGRRSTTQPAVSQRDRTTYAVPVTPDFDFSPDAARTVHIQHIPVSLTERQLSEFVREFGPVIRVRVCGNTKREVDWTYGFVEYGSIDAARRLLSRDGAVAFQNYKLRVSQAKNPMADKQSQDASLHNGCVCSFGLLQPDRTLRELIASFSSPAGASQSLLNFKSHGGDGNPRNDNCADDVEAENHAPSVDHAVSSLLSALTVTKVDTATSSAISQATSLTKAAAPMLADGGPPSATAFDQVLALRSKFEATVGALHALLHLTDVVEPGGDRAFLIHCATLLTELAFLEACFRVMKQQPVDDSAFDWLSSADRITHSLNVLATHTSSFIVGLEESRPRHKVALHMVNTFLLLALTVSQAALPRTLAHSSVASALAFRVFCQAADVCITASDPNAGGGPQRTGTGSRHLRPFTWDSRVGAELGNQFLQSHSLDDAESTSAQMLVLMFGDGYSGVSWCSLWLNQLSAMPLDDAKRKPAVTFVY